MIVRSIKVTHWKCFVEPLEIGTFSEQINIIHAPNATGKSTLFEAFSRALLDSYRVAGQEVTSIRPHGRILSPIVSVEFSYKGIEYRITKQFLEGAKSVLEQKEENRFIALHEGTHADQWCQTLISRNLPGRGLTKPEHWGLAQVLWVPQEGIKMIPLQQDVISNIQTSLGMQISNTEAAPLERRIEELYGEIFTSAGKLKSGKNAPQIIHMREEMKAFEEEQRDLQEQLLVFDESSARVQNLRARRVDSKAQLESLRQQLIRSRQQAEEYARLVSLKKQLDEKAKAAEARYDKITQHIQAVQRAQREELEYTQHQIQLETNLQAQQNELDSVNRELSEARSTLADIRSRRSLVDQAVTLADQAQSYRENQQQLNQIHERLEKLEAIQHQIHEMQEKRLGILAPDGKKIKAISQTARKLKEIELQIDSSLITLEIIPFTDGTVIPVVAEQLTPSHLSSNVPVQIKGSPEVVVDLPQVARVRATGPTGDIEDLRKAYAETKMKMQQLTEPYATDDLDQLESLMEKARELDHQIQNYQSQLEIVLDNESQEEIKQEKARLEQVSIKWLNMHPDWTDNTPDVEALRLRAGQIRDEFVEQVEAAEKRLEQIQHLHMDTSEKLAQIQSGLEQTKKRLVEIRDTLKDLNQETKSLQQLEDEKRTIVIELDTVRVHQEDNQQKLSEFGDNPQKDVARFEEQISAMQAESENLFESEKAEEARLGQLSCQAPYSRLSQIEEKITVLKEKIQREEERIAAINLLYQTVSDCRTQAIAAVTDPVEKIATRILHRIAGGRIGRVELDDNFITAGVHSDRFNSSLPLDSLSGGEQEQCYFATRIALAQVLAKEERQLVVLDDSMVFTDSGRFSRVLSILEEAAEKLQILILTCHPERYASLAQATPFDLEQISLSRQNN